MHAKFFRIDLLDKVPVLASIALILVLGACQTTDPVELSYTTGSLKERLQTYWKENAFNQIDYNECEEDKEYETPDTISVNRLDFCIVISKKSQFDTQEIADVTAKAYQKVIKFLPVVESRRITIIVRKENSKKTGRVHAPTRRIVIPERLLSKGIDEGIFIHELTHVLFGISGPFIKNTYWKHGRTNYNLAFSGLLNEGLAQYLQFELMDPDHPLKSKVKPHRLSNKIITIRPQSSDLDKLHETQSLFSKDGILSTDKTSARSYFVANSFVKYLIEKHGMGKFTKVYRGVKFHEVYNYRLPFLEERWKTFLKNKFPSQSTEKKATDHTVAHQSSLASSQAKSLQNHQRKKLVNVEDINECRTTDNFKNLKEVKIDRHTFCVVSIGLPRPQVIKVARVVEEAYKKVISFLALENPRRITIILKPRNNSKLTTVKAPIGRIIVPTNTITKKVYDHIFVSGITQAVMGLSGPFKIEVIDFKSSDRKTVQKYFKSRFYQIGLMRYLENELSNKDKSSKYNLHKTARKIQRRGFSPSFFYLHTDPKLFKASGDKQKNKRILRNHILAGSFVKYLIESKGLKKFLKVYRGSDFFSLYGLKLNSAENEWQEFLEKIPLS